MRSIAKVSEVLKRTFTFVEATPGYHCQALTANW